jgi:hypothetical protein
MTLQSPARGAVLSGGGDQVLAAGASIAPRPEQISVLLRKAGFDRAVPVPGRPGEQTAGFCVRMRGGEARVTFWQDTRDPVGHLPEHLDQAIADRRAEYAAAIRAAGWTVSEGSFMLTVTASDKGGQAS